MIIVNTSFSPILYMPESVADKTPMPITIERRHIDPPGLWIAIVIGSVALHSLVLWLMFSSTLNLVGRRSGARTPIQVVEVVPRANIKAKPRIIAQKPKVQSKLPATVPIQVKPQVKPQSLPQTVPNQPVPVQPSQNQASQPGTITFTNNIPVKKPVNKPPVVQKKERTLPPVKPKVEQKTALIPPKPLKTEPKKPNQTLAEQSRLQQEAEQSRLQQEAEQRRLQQEAEQQRQQKLAQQQRQQEAEQQRQQKLAQQQRQEEIDAQRQKEEVARNQANLPVGSPVEVDGNSDTPFSTQTPQNSPTPTPTLKPTSTPTPRPTATSIPKPTTTPATTTADSTSTQGGFWIVSLSPISDDAQNVFNAKNSGNGSTLTVPPRLQNTTITPKKLPVLDEKDKKLVTKPTKCLVRLFINANGNIDEPGEGSPAIKATGEPGTGDLCQRYAQQYFNLNKENIKFLPGKDVGGIASPGYMLTYITIQPAASEKKNPS